MTDVEDLLRADGERWRAGQPAPPEPDVRRIARGRAPRWQPFAAAAAALIVLAGAALVGLAATHRGRVLPATGPASPRPSGPVPLDRLLIRDGDLVATSGQVLALPDRPLRFCPPTAFTLEPVVPDGQGRPPYCANGITLVGADLHRLEGRVERAGAVWGEARIEGRYSRGTIHVTAQGPPNRGEEDPSAAAASDERPPCPAPPGGWRPGGVGRAGWAADGYVRSHPDRYGPVESAYPYGHQADIANGPEVLVVGAVDPARAERELRTMYTGNLCVFRVPHSASEVFAARGRLGSAVTRAGAWAYGVTDYDDGTVRVIVVMVEGPMYALLRSVDRGTGILDARPWLWPVGR